MTEVKVKLEEVVMSRRVAPLEGVKWHDIIRTYTESFTGIAVNDHY